MLKENISLLIVTFLFFFASCASDDEVLDSSNGPVSEATTDPVKHRLTLTISPENGGSVDVPDGFYDEGVSIELKGTPNSIYRFKEWQGDLLGDENPNNLLIDEDKTVTAVFEFNDLDKTYVPDDNFEKVLIDLGYDDVLDNYVLTSNIDQVTSLNVTNKGIAVLTGIENFINLELLQCGNNDISSLDLTNNRSLISLYCSDNQISELNVIGNNKLEVIHFSNNQILDIDLSTNTTLKYVYGDSNMLTRLDLEKNRSLKSIYCDNNDIQEISLVNNIELEELHCSENRLTSLDLSHNSELIELKTSFNFLEKLDLSFNPKLRSLDCSNNELIRLNLKNGSNHEMPGLPQNPHDNFFGIRFNNNPLLNCVQVDDSTAANNSEMPYTDWNKDENTVYSEACD